MWWCNLDSIVLQDSFLAAQTCSGTDDSGQCLALCPNEDISGVGVRSAFYIQSLLNTLLVVFSRRDSVPSTWAATLLTAALVIAAMVQKRNQDITLHHAILTMNFATLSCISSLAVAPTLSLWRLTPWEYYAKRLARDLLDDEDDHEHRMISTAVDVMTNHKRRIERAQSRQRLFLALALLTQVVLQWAWGVTLFVSPVYSQTNCSGDTKLIFFLARFTAREINNKYMVVWVFWLLFSLGTTLFMTIVLALTSPARARPPTIRSSPVSTIGTRASATPRNGTPRPLYEQLYRSAIASVPAWKDRAGQLIFWYNTLSVVLWLVFIISSELQIKANCIFEGENTITSFGQITALLLSLAPLWSLIAALYKWPQYQRKLERRRRREQTQLRATLSLSSPVESTTVGVHLDTPVTAATASPHVLLPVGGHVVDTIVSVVAATPTGDRAPPHSHTAHVNSFGSTWAHVRARATRPRGPRAPSGSRHYVSGSMSTLNDVLLPRTSTAEWDELAAFSRAPRS